VQRVNWLRAKARANRWSEELKIVKKEMEWTMNWLDKQAKQWMSRGQKSQGEGLRGHECYAEKQQVLWVTMLEQAKRAFSTRIVI
jgi:hypothetical protein